MPNRILRMLCRLPTDPAVPSADPYLVGDDLGNGCFGRCYKVTDRMAGRTYAGKLLMDGLYEYNMQRELRHEIENISFTIPHQVPKRLAELIEQILQRDPRKRPSLDQILEHRCISSHLISHCTSPQQFAQFRRHHHQTSSACTSRCPFHIYCPLFSQSRATRSLDSITCQIN